MWRSFLAAAASAASGTAAAAGAPEEEELRSGPDAMARDTACSACGPRRVRRRLESPAGWRGRAGARLGFGVWAPMEEFLNSGSGGAEAANAADAGRSEAKGGGDARHAT